MSLVGSELELSSMKAELDKLQAQYAAKEAEVQKMREEEEKNKHLARFSQSNCAGRSLIKAVLEQGEEGVGSVHTVAGWVKTGRMAEKNTLLFVELDDGSTPKTLQIIVRAELSDNVEGLKHTGTSICIEGTIVKAPEGARQAIEMQATKIVNSGACDAKKFPIAKKKMTLEYLRSVGHLRARTRVIAAVARVRNALAYATHTFFQQNQFVYVHTPLITCSDCEGAGEMFQVTTLLSHADEAAANPPLDEAAMAALKAEVSAQGSVVKDAKAKAKAEGATDEDKKAMEEALKTLNALKAKQKEAEEKALLVGGIKRTPEGGIDYKEDFFGKKAFLTVSGQLQVETFACAMGNVYTFGPTFRAENSHTSRHLAEFWMIEPEIAFADIYDDMKCAEEYVQFCCKYLLETCMDDMEFFEKMYDKECINRCKMVASTPFQRITYTEAVEMLIEHSKNGKVKEVLGNEFENVVEWGCDLASEHERYLSERVFKKPTIVYNYPKDIKAFYMRLNDDEKTVAAMDVLVPGVGELIGGSQREERMEVLMRRIDEMNLDPKDYDWFLDTRRYGTVPHAGFGLGFERLILFATGMENIRDVIPFPRWPGNADL
mmetsp:Transcript_39392/g.47771  ORF Transcript_39392/g.47771 Transcript_39392/m.47771 type:complete len:603 (-) Transcript_39392:137-1945(-)|eukprot:CAMPEP_0197850188 /NCGR_PEP_ID=MMETSP1438-20131217/14564_1 /TAXON_ID=1461541 /ORGANISM="Pterosperma sp., Strain CCMP1384" /LENGTH=602 /DNA_ID=CAMNT_0043463213 /DNA_START=143 /DNA_END=1951 /DNA_ORIENTATION=+